MGSFALIIIKASTSKSDTGKDDKYKYKSNKYFDSEILPLGFPLDTGSCLPKSIAILAHCLSLNDQNINLLSPFQQLVHILHHYVIHI